MPDCPLVSIALPVYNAEKTLEVSLSSVLLQTYRNWELFIIDDGSADAGLSIAEQFRDDRIKIIANGTNRGISACLNQAVDKARGKYFARMDADDVAFPERLERQVDFLESHPEIDLSSTGILYINNKDVPEGILPVRETHEEICRNPWMGFYMPHPTWVGRTEWFRKNRYRSRADGAEDQDILFRTWHNSCFACLKDVLLAYRQDKRRPKKMLRARYVFFKAASENILHKRLYLMFLKLCIVQSFKVVADIIHHFLPLPVLKNHLLPVPQNLYENWQSVLLKINSNCNKNSNF